MAEHGQEISKDNYCEIRQNVSRLLEPLGFEVYPFKIGWYNERVSPAFKLSYDYDCLAFVVISTPDMFEKAFIPFVQRVECCGDQTDLIDQCMRQQFQQVKEMFKDYTVDCIHDFELHHSRRPKVLVQTAGHVAGAAYYYQRSDVVNDPWASDAKIFGVSVHPKYGGWFALRGVMIFKDVLVPDLHQVDPVDCLPSDASRIEVLERFNNNWRDWTFRDVIPAAEKYSEAQKDYFSTAPQQRKDLLERWKNHCEGDSIGNV